MAMGWNIAALGAVATRLSHAYGVDGALMLADPEAQAQLGAARQRQVDALLFDEDRQMLGAKGVIVGGVFTLGKFTR